MTRIFFAGAENKTHLELLEKHKVENILWSFFYCKDKIDELLEETKDKNIMMDSGAFTADSKGAEIDIFEYIEFLKKYGDKFISYVVLDVIGNARKTLENQKIMEQAGLKPLPVFHEGEPWQVLIDYCKNYEYVGLGGVAIAGKTPREKFLKNCFRIGGEYGTKFHGFGITDPYFIKKYNFYSVDSTSWLSGSRYGSLFEFDEKEIKMRRYALTEKNGQKFGVDITNNSQIDKHNLEQWKKIVVVFEKLENNNSERWSEIHKLKLSQKKIGNTNAIKTGKYADIEHLSCDFCRIKDQCPCFKEGKVCSYDKEIIKFNVGDRDVNKIKELLACFINKNQQRWKRTEIFERLTGGELDEDSLKLENHMINLAEKFQKLENLKGGKEKCLI